MPKEDLCIFYCTDALVPRATHQRWSLTYSCYKDTFPLIIRERTTCNTATNY